jgi:hypothetical protein
MAMVGFVIKFIPTLDWGHCLYCNTTPDNCALTLVCTNTGLGTRDIATLDWGH